MRRISQLVAVLVVCLSATGAQAATFKEMFPGNRNYSGSDLKFLKSLNYRQGTIEIPEGNVTMNVSRKYYFLDARDARKVYEDVWGNPRDRGILGMIFPARRTPLHHKTWGATIFYNDFGYVSDEEAEGLDYSALMKEMQAVARASSKWRIQNGYEYMELLGWASLPEYDRDQRKVHWAVEYQFGVNEVSTLNYDIHALGRHGVLVTGFIADIDQLPSIKRSIPSVMAMSTFTEGNRHTDYFSGIDQAPAMGFGDLISGRELANTDPLANLLSFLTNFWLFLILPFMAAFGWLTRKRKSSSASWM